MPAVTERDNGKGFVKKEFHAFWKTNYNLPKEGLQYNVWLN